MAPPLIIYFGKPGLETQVFQSYMVASGYQVQVVNSRESVSTALEANREAIVVFASGSDQDPRDLTAQVQVLRANTKVGSHIIVISPDETADLQLSGVDVIPKPFRLSELVRRIRALTPG